MKIQDLPSYVKFIFNLKDQDLDFVTSDISLLKERVQSTEFKIGDIIVLNKIKCEILNISIKDVNEDVRSNKYGYNQNEGSLQGELKDSLITVAIDVLELLS